MINRNTPGWDGSLSLVNDALSVFGECGMTETLLQEIKTSRDRVLAGIMMQALYAHSKKVDCRFNHVRDFSMIVPKDYRHEKCLDGFRQNSVRGHELFAFHDDFNDLNHGGVSYRAVPGRTYQVEIFQSLEALEIADYLNHACAKGGELLGAQGIVLAYCLGRDNLPRYDGIDKAILAPDEEECNGTYDGEREPTCLFIREVGLPEFGPISRDSVHAEIKKGTYLFRFIPQFK